MNSFGALLFEFIPKVFRSFILKTDELSDLIIIQIYFIICTNFVIFKNRIEK